MGRKDGRLARISLGMKHRLQSFQLTTRFLDRIGYRYSEETDNSAYQMFLR